MDAAWRVRRGVGRAACEWVRRGYGRRTGSEAASMGRTLPCALSSCWRAAVTSCRYCCTLRIAPWCDCSCTACASGARWPPRSREIVRGGRSARGRRGAASHLDGSADVRPCLYVCRSPLCAGVVRLVQQQRRERRDGARDPWLLPLRIAQTPRRRRRLALLSATPLCPSLAILGRRGRLAGGGRALRIPTQHEEPLRHGQACAGM